MVRSRLASLKHISYALAFLGSSLCAVELGLHLHEACSVPAADDGDRGASVRSWTVHHMLKPSAHVVATDPDSNAPNDWWTNSIGLRAQEIAVPKPPGVFRIICLGDESTLSAETPEPMTFCARLQEMLREASPNQIEVINAGCPQYGPLLSYLQLRHTLLPLSPDLVVLNFDMSDVADDHQIRRYARMSGSQPLVCPHPELELLHRGAAKSWPERLLTWNWCKQELGLMLGNAEGSDAARDIDSPHGMYAWLRDEPPDWSVYIQQTREAVAEIAALCRQSNCAFILAAIPCPWQISAEASNGQGVRPRAGVEEHAVFSSRSPNETLEAAASEARIPYCDAFPAFRQSERGEQLFYVNARRLSPAGHERYARVLGEFLARNVAGPWQTGPTARRPLPPRSQRPIRHAGFDDNATPVGVKQTR